ncbi:inner centromere protein A-like isoform X5 [Cololabis saira]|uniref:inner centromere protein A-like isoform X5 n=1 Tax=Cololabis saira TaxID=129043 RepID=UPI002AD442BF|nr:inner centromere protein A-like isoform X5 [Cololabis saira]
MNSVLTSVRSLMQVFDGKMQEFISEIDNVHMVWLEEIQQEANRMFSRDFNAEPELMPKTPSQKKNSRRKRVSLGRQEENQARRRFSKGKRSNLRGSSVKPLNLILEDESIPEVSTSETSPTVQPKRNTRKNKQTKPEVVEDEDKLSGNSNESEKVQNKKPQLEVEEEEEVGRSDDVQDAEVDPQEASVPVPSPPKIPLPKVVVRISSEERLSAELAKMSEASPGRTATKIPIADATQNARRSSVRCSLKLRHSVAGLRHSMTQESVRRASQRSMLKRKAARMGKSTCSSNISEDSSMDTAEEEDAVKEAGPADTVDNTAAEKSKDSSKNKLKINRLVLEPVERITRSVAANSPKLAPPPLFVSEEKVSTPVKRTVAIGKQQTPVRRTSRSTKRKAPDTVEDSPTKRLSPPKKSQTAIRPNMKTFLHTVQKNQLLMMTPSSLGRTSTIKSFIKHTTPLKLDLKTKERYKLEALKKKQEQEEERMRKMEEEKKKKQDELKRKRDERMRRVFEAKVKEEQREEEKKKKIEQKMAQIEGKNDKQRQAEEKAKKKVTLKRQEELEQKKLEEEAKKKKMQQEEEKRQQELLTKKKEEEELKALRALELKRQQERERQAAAERERVEKEKALALQRELERAAREKEMRELEEKRKALEEKRKLEEQQRLAAKEKALKEKEAKGKEAAAHNQASANLNVTVDIEKSVMNTPKGKAGGINVTLDIAQSSPQSYVITPKGGNKPTMSKSQEDYGMDQNSDDSTDDESAPRKQIPSWAEGPNLKQIIMKQYFNPPDLDSFFGIIEPPKLENIFYKSKPRYFKRTSSAVWHSPPGAK